jgi:3-deoxy-D-manno-octulosonic-acid transferase
LYVFFYNIFLGLFRAGTFIYSFFNEKAGKWVEGRKNIFERLEAAIPKDEKIIWMHCASLGEFEQGRPVLEKLKSRYSNYKFLVTFFSPSGYEVSKDYKNADWVFYLPADGPRNARRFLEIVHPSLVIFVKYEFWFYYLKKIKYLNIPIILISAVFRKEMPSFKWIGRFLLKMLSRFNHIFLQNENSAKLLDEFNLPKNYSIAGDTRFDRVIEIAENFQPLSIIEQFIGNSKTIIAGSTWPEDEEVLGKAIAIDDPLLTVIIAPHEISDRHLAALKKIFPYSLRFSEMLAHRNSPAFQKTKLLFPDLEPTGTSFLIIDSFGILSRLYKYADITFVGGGFRPMGVHNVTEAAVYGKPVITGPYISKYTEAVELVERKGGFTVNNEAELRTLLNDLISNKNDCCTISSKASYNYIRENAGAVEKILNYIQVKRLLTS